MLNADGAGNVAGFRNHQGELRPLADGVRALSASGGTNPAQVGFGADGEILVVTEKATSRITSYPVQRNGTLGRAVVTASSGATPFGRPRVHSDDADIIRPLPDANEPDLTGRRLGERGGGRFGEGGKLRA